MPEPGVMQDTVKKPVVGRIQCRWVCGRNTKADGYTDEQDIKNIFLTKYKKMHRSRCK